MNIDVSNARSRTRRAKGALILMTSLQQPIEAEAGVSISILYLSDASTSADAYPTCCSTVPFRSRTTASRRLDTMDTIKRAAVAVADTLPVIPGVTAPTSGQRAAREPPVEQWLKADEVEKIEPDEEEKAYVLREADQVWAVDSEKQS